MEPAFFEGKRARTTAQQIEDAPLFQVPAIEPPSQPIASSERAAAELHKSGVAVTQAERIVRALYDAGCFFGKGRFLSRDELIERTGLSVNAITGRLGPSGPLTIAAADYRPGCAMAVVAAEDASVSRAGNLVMGYSLTPHGVRIAESSQ